MIDGCEVWCMTTNTLEGLQKRIEQLVRMHLASQRSAAMAAVERAFAAAEAPTRPRAARTTTGRRRASTEMSRLAERLYEAVCANPGETITVIAAHVSESPRALSRPMFHLKGAGRVRSAGQRSFTRYFPMASAGA